MLIRSLIALTLSVLAAPSALAGQSAAPVLALWEFDGWAAPTVDRPLGLRFALLEDGNVIFGPDDPAIDTLIPNSYFQAQLSPEEVKTLMSSLAALLQQQPQAAPEKQRGWTAFYFRDATGQQRNVEFAGHPCLAHGRIFSATEPVAGLKSAQNSADRAALPQAMHDACNLLTNFHHASIEAWSPQALPAFLPQR